MALVSTAAAGPLAARAEARVVSLSGKLLAAGTARLLVYLPAWQLAPASNSCATTRRWFRLSFDAEWVGTGRATATACPAQTLPGI
ncbi:MAG: hypothetical protein PHO07_16630 [Pirellulales bacterium]|jgi:hypothetical protein|nr:hypothetical protein [Thermoguttaceae bacterium]MDD4788799.1 hypothetical protein [Pirellulales bacterium]MDI9446601.1 hypothetical protein [Planctomycetota bacterium]NLZ01065.1 hypothetical protein [Pirellulaceae bacterium]